MRIISMGQGASEAATETTHGHETLTPVDTVYVYPKDSTFDANYQVRHGGLL